MICGTSRILVLTAGFGEGHNSAARALRQAIDEHAPEAAAELIDVFALRAPRFNAIARSAYVRLINGAPRLWSGIYRWLDHPGRAPLAFRSLAGHRRLLEAVLADRKPGALCSTYPAYSWLIEPLRRNGRMQCPLFTVVTDAITIHSLWYRAASDAWFVTDGDSAAFLAGRGIPDERIRVSGFPISPAFADRTAELVPPDPRGATAKRVLFMINSGRSRALETARALLGQAGWHITFTTGRDARLRNEIERLASGAPASAEVVGWTERIPELLMTHHLVVSKAGGATTQEAVNAHCPLIINQVVPGQEEGNCELIRRIDAGAVALSPGAIVAAIQSAFSNDAARWRRWRANLQSHARPSAARTIAAEVLARARCYS